MTKEHGFNTRAIHAGQEPDPSTGAIMTPIFQSSTFVQASPGVHRGYEYARTGNPTRTALEANLASLENLKHGLSFSSGVAGMNAIISSFDQGDHFVVCDDVYGGTQRMFKRILSRTGFSFTFVDMTDLKKIESAITNKTKLIWVESPTNPMMKVMDIAAIASFAKSKKLLTCVDNTFCSPAVTNPTELGADIVLHSTTKYIGGHSDVVGGFVGTNSDEIHEKLRFNQNTLGAVPGPMDCFLTLRGTKTLGLRIERHSSNALAVAKFLEGHERVERVFYPGLESHPQHAVAKKQMRLPGGMLSLVLKGGLDESRTFLERVKIFALAESLGGVESLIEHPAIMTHASVPAEVRKELGISDSLVRLSVGVEDEKDLLADLDQALSF